MINKRFNDTIEIRELDELDTLKDKKVIKQLHLNFAEYITTYLAINI